MIEFAVFISLFFGDLIVSIIGSNTFLLTLFPPYLFIRDYSLPTVLFGGGFGVLLAEFINNFLLGSLLLGVGVSFMLVQGIVDILNWSHPLTEIVCLFLYLSCIFLVRSTLIYVLDSTWVVVSVGPFMTAYLTGCAMIAYRFFHSEGPRERV